jgi:hypothetical protein
VSNAVFTVRGTASDNVQVANVWLQLNGGVWTNAATANGWTNWSAALNLIPGTNTVSAFAVDAAGNVSATNRQNFQFVVTNILSVKSVGLGTISPNYSNAWLEIGRNYSLTATGTNGHEFTQWQVTSNPAAPAVLVLTNRLNFTMQSNLALTAVFVDTNRPTVTVTNLVANQRISNAVYAVRGTAGDNAGVSNLWFRLNGPLGQWILATGSSNWTAQVTANPGTNLFQAYAEDAAGNRSVTAGVAFAYVVTARLLVEKAGQGGFAPNYNNVLLALGTNYTMTATASNGHKFGQWEISTNWGAAVLQRTAALTFNMQSNLTLRVVFIDTNWPSVTVTNLKASQVVYDPLFPVKGTNRDNVGVSRLLYRLTNSTHGVGLWMTNEMGASNAWAVPLDPAVLAPRTNTFQVCGEDAQGNRSLTNSVNFIFPPGERLSVHMIGQGTLTPAYSNLLLAHGTNYSMTAAGGHGYTFARWLQTTKTGTNEITAPRLDFTMVSNLSLTAVFEDKTPPSITAPPNLETTTEPGLCSATALMLGLPEASDNSESVHVTQDAPARFLKGLTTITWTATDPSGNIATAIQLVTVIDTEKPTMTAPAPVVANTDPGTNYATIVSLGLPAISDNCGVANVANNAPLDGKFAKGSTIVTWTVTDTSGNTNAATQLVTVIDTEKLTLTALSAVQLDPLTNKLTLVLKGVVPNHSYVLQWTTNLSGTKTVWKNATEPQAATNSEVRFEDKQPASPALFYRAVIVGP